MRLQPITPVNVRRFLADSTKSFLQNNADNITQPISDNINFGVGDDYGFDLLAPENTNPDKPGFKRGLMGVVTILTFPISVPALILYEKYKDKHKDDEVKTNMNYDNIED